MPPYTLATIANSLLNFIYPRYCPLCHKNLEDGYICDICSFKLEIITDDFCYRCGAGLPRGAGTQNRCLECKDKIFYFNRAIAIGRYYGNLRQIILEAKFSHNLYLIKFLGELVAKRLRKEEFLSFVEIIVPVPMHYSKLLQRWYNPPEMLSIIIAKKLKLRLSTQNLIKIRDTTPQSVLDEEQRQTNVKGVFKIRKPREFTDKVVLLVDDVLTTGSTANECARLLKEAGAKAVYLAVAAR